MPRTSSNSLFGEYHHADEEKNLEEAVRRSSQLNSGEPDPPLLHERPSLRRMDTTDQDELAMVLKISMYDQ